MFDNLKDKVSSTFSSNEEDADTDEIQDESPDETTDTSDKITAGTKAKSLLKGKRVLDEDELESQLEDFKMTLLQNDVALDVADQIAENIKDELRGEKQTIGRSSAPKVQEALKHAIEDVLEQDSEDFITQVEQTDKPFVVMFTGVNGVGKTTTIARVAKHLEDHGYSSVLANGDTYRAGAQQQIEKHADNLNKKLISHQKGGDPAAVIYDAVEYAEANDVDVVLGDTAGRLHTSGDLMEQLSKINRVVDPDRVLFVDESVAGQDAINRAEQFNQAAEVDGVVLTKADADENGGAILSIPYVINKPIYFLGVGQGYDDIEPFEPKEIADELLE